MSITTKPCEWCKLPRPMQYRQRTCSHACRDALKLSRRIESATEGECVGCGHNGSLPYQVREFWVCGIRCRGRVNARLYRIDNPAVHYKRGPRNAKATCDWCKAEFWTRRYDQRFCSTKCADKWSYRNGAKKDSREKRLTERRNTLMAGITACALCGIMPHDVKPAVDFGVRRKNGLSPYHADHLVPASCGGADSGSNRRWLCWFCNCARLDLPSIYDEAVAASGRAFWTTALNRVIPFYAAA